MNKLEWILCLGLCCLLSAGCSNSTTTGSGKPDTDPSKDTRGASPPQQRVDAVAASDRAVTAIQIETVSGDKFVLTSFRID